MLISSDKM